MLICVAFAVRLRREAAKVRQVSGVLIQVRQRHRVLLADLPVKLCLQSWPLIIGEGQREQGFGLTHKLVHVALSSHLQGDVGDGCCRHAGSTGQCSAAAEKACKNIWLL